MRLMQAVYGAMRKCNLAGMAQRANRRLTNRQGTSADQNIASLVSAWAGPKLTATSLDGDSPLGLRPARSCGTSDGNSRPVSCARISFPARSVVSARMNHAECRSLQVLSRDALLVVSMAAVTVRHMMADDSPGAIDFRQILVRLSGRQMKRSRPVTAPALLTGLWSLLAMLDTLEQIDVGALKNLMAKVKLPVPIISTA